MFAQLSTLLSTPIVDFAPVRLAGSSLIFLSGPVIAWVMQDAFTKEAPSLSERHFRALQVGIGFAGFCFVTNVPFATSPLVALAYAVFLVIVGEIKVDSIVASQGKSPELNQGD